ncbi:MAG TPA: hypothetical protein QGH10_18535, partial [Armatimonadota bacterium]|nr:hypothetical protein [Armatimonadota bacterium]
LVGGLALHRNPAYTSWMLLTLVAIAAISGVVFTQRRSFCKAFCPANLLLSVHGRMTPLQIAAADTGTCESCKTKDCIRKDRSGRWNGASCPSGVPVYSRRDGDACVLCFQCAKACPHDNVGFGLQATAPRRRSPLSVAEALFVVVASGFVMHELFTEIKPLEGIFHYPAEQLHAILGEPIAWSWMHASWYLVGFPAALWGIVLGVLRAAGRRGIAETLAASALVLAPVIAACHLSKALAKLNSWGPYLTTSLADPQGVPAAETFFSKASSAAPAGALPFTVIAAAAIALCLSGGVYAWSRRAPTGSMLPRLIVPLVGVMYLTVLVLWLVAH